MCAVERVVANCKNKLNAALIDERAALRVARAIKDASRTQTPFYIFLLCDT